jgi:hypothetical protein
MSVSCSGRWILVEVDPVGAEPTQAVLDLAHDPASRVVNSFGSSPIDPRTLVASTTLSRRPPARALPTISSDSPPEVDVGGVDEVDARIERAVDDPDRLVVVALAPGAEHHRAEAERTDLDPGASERAVLHGRRD